MAGSTPSENSTSTADEKLRQIESRLKEKEALLEERNRTVQELTDRLSQTVEKLDRYKRGGSGQNVIRMATFPKEVVDQQTELVGDLKRAVELWENMQLSCGLGRLESQLTDLHKLYAEHFKEEEPEEPEDDDLNLDDSEDEDEANEELDLEDESSLDDDEEIELVPAPAPGILDPVMAGDGELRRCIDQQEAYIDYLSARLRRATNHRAPIDWDEIAGDPQKITQELESTVEWIEESRHFAEFELALQQTRLKRTERDLAQLTAQLEQQMLSLDSNNRDNSDEDEGGGWLRMLGVKK